MSKKHIFIGPTGNPKIFDSLKKEGFIVHAPIRRGDMTCLYENEIKGIVVIVDGTFHSYPAVGHQEIKAALSHDWKVWGLSSMGAIRAAELQEYGMRGYGKIYEMFIMNDSFSDDEVTLVHSTDYPYINFSEPLVHIRKFVDKLEEQGDIDNNIKNQLLDSFKNRWYGDRTTELLQQWLKNCGGIDLSLEDVHLGLEGCQVKTEDLELFIANKEWEK